MKNLFSVLAYVRLVFVLVVQNTFAYMLRWGYLSCYVSRRGLTTSVKTPLKKATGASIVEDSDFAFRKTHLASLEPAIQDLQWYPGMSSIMIDAENMVRVPKFREMYSEIDETVQTTTTLCGKVTAIRKAGKGSLFVDVVQDGMRVQLIVHHKLMGIEKEGFLDHHSKFRPGDQVLGVGFPGRTKVGELSLKLTKPLVLGAPALHPLPPKLTDSAKINSNRVVDYLVNQRSRDVMVSRSKVINSMRAFFDDMGFLEVETPIIGSGNTGANATPFTTSSVHIKNAEGETRELSLRVAPELWLKKLTISGFDQIYEISKVFRNEGVDGTHNPEFTTCEFYKTFTSLEELMGLTEKLFSYISRTLLASERYSITHGRCQELLDHMVANGGHFKRIDFVRELEAQTGEDLPGEFTVDSLVEYYHKIGLTLPSVVTENQLLDNLSSTYLEPKCGACPTFIFNLPEILSPLAKSSVDARGRAISRRFELYINGKEYVNAYEEENNPFKQARKFREQQRQQDAGDAEALVPDHRFVEFMEWGMPPTGGWGLGIDRLVMYLTQSERIERVLPFGRLPDVLKH